MKVVYLVAGAGGMYCGTCLRDNRLAAALRRQGRDLVLIPLYTPIRTDEPDVSERAVSYGGINVYLQHRWGLFRHLPKVLDRLLGARALLRIAGRFAARTRPEQVGALTVSVLRGGDGLQRRQLRQLIERVRSHRPTVVHLPNLMFVGIARELKEHLGAQVFCSLAGEDVFLDALQEPYRRQALTLIGEGAAHVDAFVAPTNYYASCAAGRFGLDPSRVHQVPLGVGVHDVGEAACPSDEPFTIGYLARICPEKGLHVLMKAFARLVQLRKPVRLRVAGYLSPQDRPYFEKAVASLKNQGLEQHFEYVGEVTRAQKLAFLRSLHLLSVPTVVQESKGLYVLEAMASGVPVVQPRHGSFPELIEATGGGLLYDTDRPDALTEALARLMDDHALRESLAERGRRSVHESFTDEVMARKTWELYERLAGSDRGDARAATTGA